MVPKMSDEERRLKVRMGIADLLRLRPSWTSPRTAVAISWDCDAQQVAKFE